MALQDLGYVYWNDSGRVRMGVGVLDEGSVETTIVPFDERRTTLNAGQPEAVFKGGKRRIWVGEFLGAEAIDLQL